MKPVVHNVLVDVGVGRHAEDARTRRGIDVLAVRSLDPRMSDGAILKVAAADLRMVITINRDFGELVHHSRLSHAGVLLLRLEDATGPEKAAVLDLISGKFADKLWRAFCVYQAGKLRIRAAKGATP